MIAKKPVLKASSARSPVAPAPVELKSALNRVVHRVLVRHGRAGQPVFVTLPDQTRATWVLLDRSGKVKTVLGRTLSEARRANPVAIARLRPDRKKRRAAPKG